MDFFFFLVHAFCPICRVSLRCNFLELEQTGTASNSSNVNHGKRKSQGECSPPEKYMKCGNSFEVIRVHVVFLLTACRSMFKYSFILYKAIVGIALGWTLLMKTFAAMQFNFFY